MVVTGIDQSHTAIAPSIQAIARKLESKPKGEVFTACFKVSAACAGPKNKANKQYIALQQYTALSKHESPSDVVFLTAPLGFLLWALPCLSAGPV